MKTTQIAYSYLLSIAFFILAAFLPVSRTLLVARLQGTIDIGTTFDLFKGNSIVVARDSIMEGDIPISMIFSIMGLLLLSPTIFAVYLTVRLWNNHLKSMVNNSKKLLWKDLLSALKEQIGVLSWQFLLYISGISLVCLILWWGIWSGFKVVPAIGYWVYIIGIASLTISALSIRRLNRNNVV
jgi:hypothetical protein